MKIFCIRSLLSRLLFGLFRFCFSHLRALAFSRRTEHDHCLTAVNAGDELVTLTLPWDGTLAEDALSHQEFFCGNGLLRLTLEPYGTMLLTQPQE